MRGTERSLARRGDPARQHGTAAASLPDCVAWWRSGLPSPWPLPSCFRAFQRTGDWDSGAGQGFQREREVLRNRNSAEPGGELEGDQGPLAPRPRPSAATILENTASSHTLWRPFRTSGAQLLGNRNMLLLNPLRSAVQH